MPLEVLTRERTNGLAASVTIGGMPAEFLWGIKLTSQDVQPRKAKFELVYECAGSSLIDLRIFKELRALGYELTPTSMTKSIYVAYVANPHSLEEIKSGSIINVFPDRRYILCGSPEFYKNFFNLVNRDRINGVISDEQYAQIYYRFFDRSKEIALELEKRCSDNMIAQILKKHIEDFCKDPVIMPYTEKVRTEIFH